VIRKLQFFDFCAGIGSAHFAFANLGLTCAGFSEIEATAIKMYTAFHGIHKNYGDIMQINPHALPDFDILCAGFPCQTFSIVGKRQGFDDSRGQIIYGLCDILKIKQPKAFLLENVKGLVNINKGQTLKNILSMLEGAGYSVNYKVIESTAFNIPQKRERIYIVGFLKSEKVNFTFPESQAQDYDIKNFLIETDTQFIIKTDTPVYQTFLRYLNNKYNSGKYDLQTLLAQDYLVLDTRQSDLRLYENVIPTLRTGRQGILYVKNGHLRKLSGREALLLQGFEDRYAILAQQNFTQSKILSLAGNAMTVGVMRGIGERILEGLYQKIVIARNEMTKQSSENGLFKSVIPLQNGIH
jgi:DNA (cytosine-5)-methyltransferase 1